MSTFVEGVVETSVDCVGHGVVVGVVGLGGPPLSGGHGHVQFGHTT